MDATKLQLMGRKVLFYGAIQLKGDDFADVDAGTEVNDYVLRESLV